MCAVAAVAVVELAMLPFAFADTSHGTDWIAAIPLVNRVAQAIPEWGVSTLFRRTHDRVGDARGDRGWWPSWRS